MLPLEFVSRVRWSVQLGKRLRQIRDLRAISRRSLAEKLTTCSHQYLQQLEEGKTESVSVEMLADITSALGGTVSDVLPIVEIVGAKISPVWA